MAATAPRAKRHCAASWAGSIRPWRRRRRLGEDHRDTLDSAHSLAITLNNLDHHVEARALHEDTLERRRRLLGEDHPDTLTSARDLASC